MTVNKKKANGDVFFTAYGRAFTGGRKETHKLLYSADDGIVRVWDDVAGHYTTCHRISERRQRQIIARVTR